MLGALGLALGARPDPAGLRAPGRRLVLGCGTFVSLALLLAGTLRAEAVLAIANLAWVLLLGLGTLVPTDQLPGALGDVAALLPSGALGDAARTAFLDGGWPWGPWSSSSPGAWPARRWRLGSSAGATDPRQPRPWGT